MVSKAASCASAGKSEAAPIDPETIGERELICTSKDIMSLIDSLKKQVINDRYNFIKKRMDDNKQKLCGIMNHVYNLSMSIQNTTGTDIASDLLTRRKENVLCTLNGFDQTIGEKDNGVGHEDSSFTSSAVLSGNNYGGKNAFRPIKLPEVPKLPPYTTWIFLDRNQRMTEDQSVVGRRRIYYDQNCGEALICSDSEEEIVEDDEEKKEFGNSEDYILRMTIQEAGLSDGVLDSLSQCFERKTCEIKARYESLVKTDSHDDCRKKTDCETDVHIEEKDLDAALDSFDNLFCRRCLVFDCRLHGCSQDLVFPAEKQMPWNNSDAGIPCGSYCYRLALKSESVTTVNSPVLHSSEGQTHSSCGAGTQLSLKKKASGSSVVRRSKSHQSEIASNVRIPSESSESEVRPREDATSVHQSSSPSKAKQGKGTNRRRNNKRVAERVLVCIRKRQKKLANSDSDSIVGGCLWPRDMKLRSNSRKGNKYSSALPKNVLKSQTIKKCRKKEAPAERHCNSGRTEVKKEKDSDMTKESPQAVGNESSGKDEFVDENVCKHDAVGDISWKVIEKGLLAKGIEIFGRNSCLIARNLLSGMKTCSEVFQYMNFIENKAASRAGDGANSHAEGHSMVDFSETMGGEFRRRSRFLRRRGRVRRLKYTWKSAGYHSIRKRINERKDQPCRQYNPCGCQFACGKQCPCLVNGTCCEKYCGCPKICKNRFRGCHCAKSQCRSRQCPCFAADRECDPDVCRNCWVGCGDGTLGGPIQRGDNYECRNMKLLLKQQQRVLLGRSDVSGWGAFLKNSVGKHEYLGEYTGELISHREADKRGKIYDRENSSFLFNLNDQFVLDAYRKGDKLKFANHSPDPNCYAKVIMVAGDHRVGIFAKERINSGEELFYDYRYEPDRAPAWARRPETSSQKKDETVPSSGRAKKLA
uniref:Histone-lysine N-methyltransferase EZ1 n=1 Tax=Anthurium amnicola TaxID=1678845 RepID=A0A1D1Y7A5_9ARAE